MGRQNLVILRTGGRAKRMGEGVGMYAGRHGVPADPCRCWRHAVQGVVPASGRVPGAGRQSVHGDREKALYTTSNFIRYVYSPRLTVATGLNP
jgi:hypothetical protein